MDAIYFLNCKYLSDNNLFVLTKNLDKYYIDILSQNIGLKNISYNNPEFIMNKSKKFCSKETFYNEDIEFYFNNDYPSNIVSRCITIDSFYIGNGKLLKKFAYITINAKDNFFQLLK